MSEFKGTKTEWELLKGTSLLGVQIGKTIFGISNITEETKANALLISKAPELLEALIIAHKFIEENKLKNYMIELLNRQLPNLEQLIKEATEL